MYRKAVLAAHIPLPHCSSRHRCFKAAGALFLLLMFVSVPAFAADEVKFPDAELEAAVRERLMKPTGVLTSNDLAGLEWLVAQSRGITNLAGLEAAVNIDYLGLRYNDIADITPLLALTSLQILELDFNRITNVQGIANLQNLWVLGLSAHASGPKIADLSPVSGMANLQNLAVAWQPAASLNFSNLAFLRDLDLRGCGLVDLTFVTNFAGLERLSVDGNVVTNIAAVTNLSLLKTLSLRENHISDLTPLEMLDLAKLQLLAVEYNRVDLNRESPSRQTLDRLVSAVPSVFFGGQRFSPRLRINSTGGTAQLEFDGDHWTTYAVLSSTNLTNWVDGSRVTGLPLQPTRVPVELTSPQLFYRVVVEYPPE